MREAAEALRLTAQDLKKLGVTDLIVPETLGGAHRDRTVTIRSVGIAISEMLAELQGKDGEALIKDRRLKFLELGQKGLAA
jgi:acetyl-CoA carboxylase carboxyl transferase subunit alpha